MNTLDMHLVALDAKSGRELWKTTIHDYTLDGGYAATGAPLIVKDKVIVGMAGGEHPGSGFLDAYDAATGKKLWRFNTVPQPGEANFGTWAGDSWKTGGAATWNNGSYDADSNTLFWGTSNPWPDYNADARKGDNLYSCSVLALDPDTGKLKWHFQFTPQDTHDWDATQIPVLVDANLRGEPRKLMAWAARNGFYYLLDRNTGKFILAKSFVRQTWAKGFDDNGRPEVIPGNDPTNEGIDSVFPGVDGGANWMSHSYSPLTKWLYVFARDERRVFTKNSIRHVTDGDTAGGLNSVPPPGAPAPVTPPGPPAPTGIFGAGGNLPGGPGRGNPRAARFAPEESWGKVVAIDPLTGETKWEHKVISPPWGGVMSTAGNLVFGGTTEGIIFALDAKTGERLWHFSANDRVYASPISFLANGKQYVSLAVGDVLMTFGLD
ncbi:MAG: PQQ-dependent dehydrogenase, methanol/ethanol family [Bryobacterales bacterium]|nr:PQQ-dependent dehydrogenase, methanol/ethanol family [Bryobacterales bacterium]